MPLQTVALDTLNWSQLVNALRTRIVPNSANKWTLHAPVDPGVTMLELFAWLLDQRIYWMDQNSDALSLAILAMLRVSRNPARAAVTALQIEDSAIPSRVFPLVPAVTLMRLEGSNPPLLFTLDDSILLLPVDAIVVVVDGVDRSNDLAQGRPVALLDIGAVSAQIEVTLVLAEAIPTSLAGQYLSVMIELATPACDIPAQWSAAAVADVPVPATVTWSYTSVTTGAAAAFTSPLDGTGGLRRSGIVRLTLPNDWRPEPAVAGVKTASYKLLIQIESAGFTFPPVLRKLTPNVVLARHAWKRTKAPVTSGWAPLPGNVISLTSTQGDSDLKEYPPIEDTVTVTIAERDGNSWPWQRVDDLTRSGPTDRVFLLDRTHSQISFGDGLTGRLPALPPVQPRHLSDVTVSYAAGGGTDGNIGQGLFWEAQPATRADPPPLFTAINCTQGDGGAETETIDLAKARARAALNERNRAVSKMDYENLAIASPGVGLRRAYAAVGYHPDFPCAAVPGAVTIFVVPCAPRARTDGDWADEVFVAAPRPDPGSLQAARAHVDSGRLIAADVFICGPVYRPVHVTLDVALDSAASSNLRETLFTGLRDYLDPLVGGDDNRGWPFGEPVRPTALLRVAQNIVGAAGDVTSVGVLLDGMGTAESCADVPIRPHELLTLTHVDLRVQRRRPPPGGLR